MINVLALVPALFDTSPGQRFRLEQWAPCLATESIEITWAPFETIELHELLYRPGGARRKAAATARAFGRRMALLRTVKDYDLVYVFREAALVGPAILERLVKRSGVPMVFDFDDAVFEKYVSPSNGYLSLAKCPGKTATICRLSAQVMAGNPYLASWARRHNGKVTMVPTTIDTSRYTVVERNGSNGALTIGWSGSYSTVQHLEGVRGALCRLAEIVPYRLRVIGATTYDVPGVQVDALPWKAASEVDDLRPIDIGIMPLPDDRWSRGKCGLKALQYMALGIPAVCSPVGVNTDIISDGSNGYLAATEQDWVARLETLARHPARRRELGQAGRCTVEERYSARAQAPIVRRVFQQAVHEA